MSFQTEPIREWMSGPTLIAAGMSILLLAIWSPSLPAVTAMSLVALGATDVTLTRFRGTPALLPIILLHAITYGGLYAMFLGATLHAATTSSVTALDMRSLLDLAASTIPAAAAVRRIAVGLRSELAA
jgi:hypothetical protein